ncbi:MAG: hypothetical protein WAU39_07920 [Polyangiales bacterium]
MSQGLIELLRDEIGTALTEALISLPVFVALLGGTVALNSMYGAKLEAMARARRLAWLQADSGECRARSCTSTACQAAEAEIRSGDLADLDTVSRSGMSLGSFAIHVRDHLLGTYTDGVASAEARMPSTSSSPITVQRATTRVLCNATTRRTQQAQTILDQACSTSLGTTEYAREVCP